MGTRLFSLFVGLTLCVTGYGLIAPLGGLGAYLAHLDLGPLAPQKLQLGALVAALGAVLATAAVLPGQGKPKRRRKGVSPLPPMNLQPIGAVVATAAPAAEAPVATPILASAIPDSLVPGPEAAPALVAEPEPFPTEVETAAPAEPALEPAPVFAFAPAVNAEPISTESHVVEPAAEAVASEPVIEDAVFTEGPAEAAPEPAPPPAYNPPMETFEVVRTRLHQQVRGEAWSDAGVTARRLPQLAANDRERMLAAQDIGDFARAHGRMEDAAEAYEEALSYARVLHTASPTDPAKATLLADALVNSGDMAQEQGRLDSAIVAYEEAVALRREAAEASPDSHALRVLSVTLERLADAREDRGHRMRALGLYKESREIAGQLASLNPARYHSDLVITEQRLAELQTRIGG